jgi:hypothetical protein
MLITERQFLCQSDAEDINRPKYNTDNMGKLLVMVFAAPCSQDSFVKVAAPGHAPLQAILFQYTLTVFQLRSTLYRDTAPVPPIINQHG